MDRLDIVQRTREALASAPFKEFLAVGIENVQYLTGIALPFLSSHLEWRMAAILSEEALPIVICPFEVESCLGGSDRPYTILAYDSSEGEEGYLRCIGQSLARVRSGEYVAMDLARTPHSLRIRLEQEVRHVRWMSGDDWIIGLRMTKTEGEVQLLEDIAYRADHAILGASHHVMINLHRTEKFVSEDVRVHALERFLDVSGYNAMSQVAAGDHAKKFWPLAPRFGLGQTKTLEEGALVRIELQATLKGYWSSAARMISMGELTPQQRSAYDHLVVLRDTALANIKPGVPCSEIWRQVVQVADDKQFDLIRERCLGHGLGVTPYEPPYITHYDKTELRQNMIVVLDPVVRGPQGELMRSKDTILVTENGYRILGWYKDWREPYIAPYAL